MRCTKILIWSSFLIYWKCVLGTLVLPIIILSDLYLVDIFLFDLFVFDLIMFDLLLFSDTPGTAVPCHKLLMSQSTVSSPTDYTVYKCLIIKSSIQAVTMVTNHNKAYNGHTWVGTNHRLTNHRSDRPSQNETAQSWAWEARHVIPECISPDRLSQDVLQICTK